MENAAVDGAGRGEEPHELDGAEKSGGSTEECGQQRLERRARAEGAAALAADDRERASAARRRTPKAPATNAAPSAISPANAASSEITGVSASVLSFASVTAATSEVVARQLPPAHPSRRASGDVFRASSRRTCWKSRAISFARPGVIEAAGTGSS